MPQHNNRQRIQAWSQLVLWSLAFFAVVVLLDIVANLFPYSPMSTRLVNAMPSILFIAFHWYIIWSIPRRHFLTFIDTDIEQYFCNRSNASLPHQQEQQQQQGSESSSSSPSWWRPRNRNSIFIGILILNASFVFSSECSTILRIGDHCYYTYHGAEQQVADDTLPAALVPALVYRRTELSSSDVDQHSLFLTDGRHFSGERYGRLCWSFPNTTSAEELQHCPPYMVRSALMGIQCVDHKVEDESSPPSRMCHAMCVRTSDPTTREVTLRCFSSAALPEGEVVQDLTPRDVSTMFFTEPYDSDLWIRTIDEATSEFPSKIFRVPMSDRPWKARLVATFDVNPIPNDVCEARVRHGVAAGGLLVAAIGVQATMGWHVPACTALGAIAVMETWLAVVAGGRWVTVVSHVLAPVAISFILVADLFPTHRHVWAWILFSLCFNGSDDWDGYSPWTIIVAICTGVVLQFPVLDLIGWVGVPLVVLAFIDTQDIQESEFGLFVCLCAFVIGNYLDRNSACHERIDRLRITIRRHFRRSP